MRRALVAAAVSAATVLAGCGGSRGGEAQPSAAQTSVSAVPDDVPEALQFSAPLVGGGELDAGTLAGKPVVFWFWSPF